MAPPNEAAAALLTDAALVHLRALCREIAPLAGKLQRQYAKRLAALGHDPVRRRALLAISPGAIAELVGPKRPARRFLEAVEYNGRRLAKLNVPPGEVIEALRQFEPLLEEAVGGRFRPVREQLALAVTLTVNQAYYEVREAEAQAFFGLAQAEAEAQGLDDLLQRFIRVLTRNLRASAGVVAVVPESLPKALRRPVYIDDPAQAQKLLCDPNLPSRGVSWWSCPAGDQAVIQLAFSTAWPWLPRELELLKAASARCRRAMERVRLQEQLAAREKEVRQWAAAARKAEEDERRRIGRDLHDDTGQSLLVLRLQLEMLERDAPDGLQQRLADARTGVERNIVELRRTIAALNPDLLDRLGLESGLRHLAARTQKVHGLPVKLRIQAPHPVAGEPAQVVYRVAQEALHNAAKHSNASCVNLFLRIADKAIELTVRDNGVGFDAEAAPGKPMSFGLAGMRERAALADGSLTIRSVKGKGTTVMLELPRHSGRTESYGKNSSTSH